MEMRKIIIPQPWASMICAGLIDIFDLGVDLGAETCLVLIQAAPWQKYDNRKNLPLEWIQRLSAAQLMGTVPLYQDMPFDCVVGFIKADLLLMEPDSMWAYRGKRESLYLITNARMFTRPVRTSIDDEKDLPSHCKMLLPNPVRLEDGILVHVNETLFEDAREGYSFNAPMVNAFHEVLFNSNSDKSLKKLILCNNHRYKTFAFERDNDFYLALDEKGYPKRYFSILTKKTEVRPFFKFNLRKQL